MVPEAKFVFASVVSVVSERIVVATSVFVDIGATVEDVERVDVLSKVVASIIVVKSGIVVVPSVVDVGTAVEDATEVVMEAKVVA